MTATLDVTRLHPSYIETWLAKNKISLDAIEQERPVWQTAEGKIPITIPDIERLISIEDPVAWAWMNLIESKSLRDEDTGLIIIPSGNPWALFKPQAVLARTTGDLIVECGSEVGKTRDIILRTLWKIDTAEGNANTLVAAFNDNQLHQIWAEIEFQLHHNPSIGGGQVSSRIKPYREKIFRNGNSFLMQLCGFDGTQFRGTHVTGDILVDEAAKWKNWQQWSELWRAGTPAVRCRIYSTPDGDYSSPFYHMCARAKPISGSDGISADGEHSERLSEDEPQFRKRNIRKQDFAGTPLWSEQRAARLREKYHGEQSVEWLTQVEGKWGTPTFSVFPMVTLKPCLHGSEELPNYRMVSAVIDRETRQINFTAARLAPNLEGASGREEMLAREVVPFISGEKLGEAIASFFPSGYVRGLASPLIYCGADLGFSQDPTELVFQQVVGKMWSDLFRLHLRYAEELEQSPVFAWLDHASGHQVRYGVDNGSAGQALVSRLRSDPQYQRCPGGCADPVYFAERLLPFGFGNAVDEIDIDTGETLPNPDRKDQHGQVQPNRISNLEFSTRILERKMQSKNLAIASDAGAGNPNLSAPQLLVNHTMIRKSANGNRVFRGEDDHHIAARRQVALIIANGERDPFIEANKDTVASTRPRELVRAAFEDEPTLRSTFGGRGRVFSELEW